MPTHDWTRVSAGTFHDFHCTWINVPLDDSCQAAYHSVPQRWRTVLEKA